MEKDEHTTDMLFRVDISGVFRGVVTAIFPHEVSDMNGNVTVYAHTGQHMAGDYQRCINTSRKATEYEYRKLKEELETIGYNIRIVTRRDYTKYLEDYNRRITPLKA